jgi:hypothetical protein
MAANTNTPYVRLTPDTTEPENVYELEQHLRRLFPDLAPSLRKVSPTNWHLLVPWERGWKLEDMQALQPLIEEGLLVDARYLGEE